MTEPPDHVRRYLDRIRNLAPIVREHADPSEREAQLAPAVVDALHDAGLFRIFLPAGMGGGELTQMQIAQAEGWLQAGRAYLFEATEEAWRMGDAAGMNAVQTACDIERCWRDVHTITQHVILGASRYEVVGRVMLGLDPGSPII